MGVGQFGAADIMWMLKDYAACNISFHFLIRWAYAQQALYPIE